ncbi:MAG: 50S ribosomal protein L11 methyltransferase [Proteobacteria bacterium]|nr:50S ribosomal protein L11 methyltransferase [Pseudomonadota bacterium]MBU1388390.1 50S ribosomal protein L11 methyltransferase [Pseudomonadota bacterium]MBU1542786.1 50S ribosomal protein L11 methyltransferase [Pseudomonadota bacterium]MBU2480135.1 50S ribosomal protein L11 methyltransferase [Pseudomonadota bacterium]
MKFAKLIARFDAPDITIAEELICDIFFSFHLKGVVCDVPLEEPDEGFGTHTLPIPDTFSITGFIPLLDTTDIILKKIKEKLSDLSALNIQVDTTVQIVDEKDWADAWKQFFEVTRVTDQIIIKPNWKAYTPKKGELVIHLDPGMAFGTGTHPTTFMCLQMIETHLRCGASFLDIGTGSGILMIAAAKLGAASLLGIDTDPVAIQVTHENLAKNNLSQDLYTLACTTADKADKGPFTIIAANIISQVIVDILVHISERMDSDSVAILSGIIKERQDDVLKAISQNHLIVIQQEYTDEWVALAVKKERKKII